MQKAMSRVNEIKEKAPIIGEMMEQVNQSEEDILRQKLLNYVGN